MPRHSTSQAVSPPSEARAGIHNPCTDDYTLRVIDSGFARSARPRMTAGARLRAMPERIVCLTEETVETLYLLGEERRIAGVSGYAVRPPQVRREKPRVSAFISADVDKIVALEPDLVLTFSDLQADIVAALIRRNVAV